MKIVADDKIPFLKGVLEPYADVVYLPGDQIQNAALKNADALLTRSITVCNAELLENTNVKIIASATIGDDHIDKIFCEQTGIKWTTAKGCNAAAVAQYVSSALQEIADQQNFALKGKSIGIIGVGNIGKKVAKIADLFGMHVLLNDPPRQRNEEKEKFVSIKEIQKSADFISLHVPLTKQGTDKTYHLTDSDFFSGFEKPIHFINTSRGAVAESAALIRAIKNGRISSSVIDVWENEPEIDVNLLGLSSIATSHIAGYSLAGKANGTALTIRALSNHLNLGLDNWYPKISMEPKTIKINGKGLTEQDLLSHTLDLVYPIMKDDIELRKNPERFEQLRRDYIFRRENSQYLVETENVNTHLQNILSKLNLKVQSRN